MTDQKKNMDRRKQAIIGGLILLVFILLWILLGFLTALFVALFCVALAFRLDACPPLIIALVLLVVCPFLLILQQGGAAKLLAELSYFFLATGVALLFVEHIRLAWKSDKDPEELSASDEDA